MWVIVVIEAVAVAALVLYLYNIYASYDRCVSPRLSALRRHSLDLVPANRSLASRRPWYVTAAVLVGWYASFSLVVLIPTDVTSVRTRHRTISCRQLVRCVRGSCVSM